ncbi:uncharacterized protein LOC110816031 [Carica papaya]|uniref:uncharacterized protein LOC110816031 n=1 Tax=Carica papaya TaxID=3649 RepID=UPI000B8CAE48|nr:uncharacterized protein LOC110816031 [Carica papaya]
MECNKDEATRAKEIAEKKFIAKDIVGARKFALKAQNLYPGLDGISPLLATLDIHLSATNKINGEVDWYSILGVSPQADDEAVRKQYRKLALMLHPDKNKAIGADGAFKYISEAWSVLSDKSRRVAYDQRRKNKVFNKVPNSSGVSSMSTSANNFKHFPKGSTSNVRVPKSTSRASHSTTPASSHKPKPSTFWTVCHSCKMQYEYLRVYLHHNLLCPNCHEPFLAVEIPPPTINGPKSPAPWNFPQQQQHSNQAPSKSTTFSERNNGAFNVSDSYGQTNFQWGPFSRAGTASATAQAATVVQQAYEKVKREREEAQSATKREEALHRKQHSSKRSSGSSSANNSAKRRKGTEDINSQASNITNHMGGEMGGASIGNLSASKQGYFETFKVNASAKSNNTKDMQLEIQSLLMEKVKKEIRKKLQESSSRNSTGTATNEERNGTEKVNMKEEGKKSSVEACDQKKSAESPDGRDEACCIRSAPGTCSIKDPETIEMLSINVQDPDFHDFDKDRTENSFAENQIWAAYDNDDGMPRYYAMIQNVISLNPFKMRISWLNSKTNSELGLLNWVGCGFSKTCGEFRVGKHEIYSSLNSFSHKVRWTKGSRGTISIYPRKGDVWALYRNWSPDWNELTADEVIHKYSMVEVLEDYNEELGVRVAPLVKVAGFKTVFHRHLDAGEIRRIPREEMFQFSHQVPSYLLTGQEAANAPKGCRELDPAATPCELLQVIHDIKEEEFEEKIVDDVEKSNDVKIVENSDGSRKEDNEK